MLAGRSNRHFRAFRSRGDRGDRGGAGESSRTRGAAPGTAAAGARVVICTSVDILIHVRNPAGTTGREQPLGFYGFGTDSW